MVNIENIVLKHILYESLGIVCLFKPFMVIFLYNLNTFIWIQHSCLANMIYAMDLISSVIKRWWCIFIYLPDFSRPMVHVVAVFAIDILDNPNISYN